MKLLMFLMFITCIICTFVRTNSIKTEDKLALIFAISLAACAGLMFGRLTT